MSTLSLSLNIEEINKLLNTYKDDLTSANNPYIKYQFKLENCVISVYTSNKVVFQGNDAHIYAAAFLKKDKDMAGSDEVGTGDYFGPVCVCACIVETKDYELLETLGVKDSKEVSDKDILKIAPTLIKELKHSLLIVDNLTYNRVHETNNMNTIKARLHNKAYVNLIHKGYKIPSAAYVDQFEPKEAYFKRLIHEKEVYHNLTFETKAENKYIAVACASIIARYAFLKKMEEMENKYQMTFIKGASDKVDECAKEFINKYGKDKLKEVAKLHFKNTERVIR